MTGSETLVVVAGLLVDDPGVQPADGVVRGVWVAGALACGGLMLARAVLTRWTLPQAVVQRLAAAALLVTVIAAAATVPLRAAVATGTWAAAGDVAVLERQLAGMVGVALALTVGGLTLVAVSLRRAARRWALLGAAGGAVTVVAPMLTGHAVVIEPRWLGIVAMGAHLLAVAAWVGALLLLTTVLWRARTDQRVAADVGGIAADVSALALGSVALAAVAGISLAVVQVERLSALSTPYGLALLVKLMLLAAVLAVAVRNRRTVPRLPEDATAAPRLSRGVRIELLGVVVVLAASGVLSSLEPAGQAAAEAVTTQEEVAGREVLIVVDPAVAGLNELHLYVLDDGTPDASAADAEVHAVGPDGHEHHANALPAGPGHWFDPAWELPQAGTWQLTVELVLDGDDVAVEASLPVGR